jgi:ketopantoate reductase
MFKRFGRSKKKPVLEDNELTTGIVQHSVTKRGQIWISFTGHDIQCVTVHNQREEASRVARQMASAWSQGKYKTQEEVFDYGGSLLSELGKQALSARK